MLKAWKRIREISEPLPCSRRLRLGFRTRKDTLDAAQNDAEQLVIDRLRVKQQLVRMLEGIFNSIDEHSNGLITEAWGRPKSWNWPHLNL